jgi:KipI family sensor histidine kinase inhibitor
MKHPTISLLGSSAVLFSPSQVLSFEVQKRIWALAEETQQWDRVVESVPGMNNLMITFSSLKDFDAFAVRLEEQWAHTEPVEKSGRVIKLPVIYGGREYGPHLGDVMQHTGLTAEQVVSIHSEPVYPVYALGSHPGYCYLGGMDERIATPRRQTPISSLPEGSVSIGGIQTGVSASEGPSGWNTIGRTQMEFFDVANTPPTLCQPGDFIQFCVEEIIQ